MKTGKVGSHLNEKNIVYTLYADETAHDKKRNMLVCQRGLQLCFDIICLISKFAEPDLISFFLFLSCAN